MIEMRMLRQILSSNDRLKNVFVQNKLRMTIITNKLREDHLKYYGYFLK